MPSKPYRGSLLPGWHSSLLFSRQCAPSNQFRAPQISAMSTASRTISVPMDSGAPNSPIMRSLSRRRPHRPRLSQRPTRRLSPPPSRCRATPLLDRQGSNSRIRRQWPNHDLHSRRPCNQPQRQPHRLRIMPQAPLRVRTPGTLANTSLDSGPLLADLCQWASLCSNSDRCRTGLRTAGAHLQR